MNNITLCMSTWCEVRNFASHQFRLTPDPIQIQQNLQWAGSSPVQFSSLLRGVRTLFF